MTKNMNTNEKLVEMQKANGPLLEVKNLAIDFTTDDKRAVHAVRDASFSVYPGQWVAIVGESGSGKSTSASSPRSTTSCAAPRWALYRRTR